MNADHPAVSLHSTAVIIPSLNEAESLKDLLPILNKLSLRQILVCDNGSTDQTREVVDANGATWVYEPKKGYGAACFAGMQQLASDIEIVVFLDADLSDDPLLIRELVAPIVDGQCDFVLGSRVKRLREPGAMTVPQRFANWLFPVFIKIGWSHRYTDMGPFRAIRKSSLEAIDMQDRAYGWTIEMQIRAAELGLRIREIEVPYRKRPKGPSKVSGSIRGVILAAYWITRTCSGYWLTKKRRARSH